ncbi:MAG TPA: T9SS type A sorting domain-containing protein [Flavobacterium sp.]|nr:T9SS type A sorting domain-containing protein [Flavobacterium sp.]
MKKFILALFLSAANLAQSQSIFKDDLSSYTVDTPLNSQGPWTNSSATSGLGGCAGTGCTNANVILQNMGYANYGTTAKALKIDPGKDGVGRAIPAIGATGDIYVSFVLNLTAAASANANDFLRVVSGALTDVKFRLYAQSNANNTYSIGIKKGDLSNTTVYAPSQLAFGTDHLIVLKYSHLPGAADDILSVYINPAYESGQPSVASATINTGNDQAAAIDRIAFRLNQNNFMPSGAASLVSVSKDWASLGFIPLSTNDNSFENLFAVIGNQAKSGILNINSSRVLDNAALTIYTITGMLIENRKVNIQKGSSFIPIAPIQASGIYIVQLTDNAGKKYSQKIAVN